MADWSQSTLVTPSYNSGNDWSNSELVQPEEKNPKRTLVGTVKDAGITALKGAIGVPEAAVGLADLVSGGHAGKALESVGFKPKLAKQILDDNYSDAQKAANAKVENAKGFVDTAKAAIENPSTIAHAIGESLPSMLAGGAVARGVGTAAKLSQKAAPYLAGLGEGVVSAGQGAEQIRQQTDDGLLNGKQAAIAASSGALTGLIGAGSGKLAQKLGITDAQTLMAGGVQGTTNKGLARRIGEGALTEGALEELPQSVQEQMAQNVALGKNATEGVGNAAAMGLLTGGIMGGGMGMLHNSQAEPSKQPPPENPAVPVQSVEPSAPTPSMPYPNNIQQDGVTRPVRPNFTMDLGGKEITPYRQPQLPTIKPNSPLNNALASAGMQSPLSTNNVANSESGINGTQTQPLLNSPLTKAASEIKPPDVINVPAEDEQIARTDKNGFPVREYTTPAQMKQSRDELNVQYNRQNQNPISTKSVDTEKHNVEQAIRNLGGINKQSADDTYGGSVWTDNSNKGNIFRNGNGGMTLGQAHEGLVNLGYLPPDSHKVTDVIDLLRNQDPKQTYSAHKNNYDDVYKQDAPAEESLKPKIPETLDDAIAQAKTIKQTPEPPRTQEDDLRDALARVKPHVSEDDFYDIATDESEPIEKRINFLNNLADIHEKNDTRNETQKPNNEPSSTGRTGETPTQNDITQKKNSDEAANYKPSAISVDGDSNINANNKIIESGINENVKTEPDGANQNVDNNTDEKPPVPSATEEQRAFEPTHELPNGEKVKLETDDEGNNYFVSKDGSEWDYDKHATPITTQTETQNKIESATNFNGNKTSEINTRPDNQIDSGKTSGSNDIRVGIEQAQAGSNADLTQPILKTDGTPVTSFIGARGALKKQGLFDSHEVVKQDDGSFVAVPKSDANVQAAKNENLLPPQNIENNVTFYDGIENLTKRPTDSAPFSTKSAANGYLKKQKMSDEEHAVVPVNGGFAIAPIKSMSYQQFKALPENEQHSDSVLSQTYEALTGKVAPEMSPMNNKDSTPVENSVINIHEKAHEAATSPLNYLPQPTQAQKEAGNYKKGHIALHGLNITVENPKGSNRTGTDKDGKNWSVEMAHHYGYIRGSVGADNEQVDVFVGDNPESTKAFVVNQIHPHNGKFDEHKVMLGFNSEEEARAGYAKSYAKDWNGLDSIVEMPISELKTKIESGAIKKPIQVQKQSAENAQSNLSNNSNSSESGKVTPVENVQPVENTPESTRVDDNMGKESQNGDTLVGEAAPVENTQSNNEALDKTIIEQGYAHRARGNMVMLENEWLDNSVKNYRESLEKHARNDEQKGMIDGLVSDFKKEYVKRRHQVLKVGSGVASSHIAGRNNFNLKQANARGNSLDKAEENFNNWLKNSDIDAVSQIKKARTDDEVNADKEAAKNAAYKKLVSPIIDDLSMMGAIDAGKKGWNRASFANSAVRKIENLHKAGNVEALNKVFEQIESYNAKNKKPLFSANAKVWGFKPAKPVEKSTENKPITSDVSKNDAKIDTLVSEPTELTAEKITKPRTKKDRENLAKKLRNGIQYNPFGFPYGNANKKFVSFNEAVTQLFDVHNTMSDGAYNSLYQKTKLEAKKLLALQENKELLDKYDRQNVRDESIFDEYFNPPVEPISETQQAGLKALQDLADGFGKTKNSETETSSFGQVFREFHHDAQGAIKKLSESKSGEAIAALHHPDVGDIDLVWGKEGTAKSDGYGLAKLVKFHPEVIDDLQGIISSLSKNEATSTKRRIQLESKDHKASVRLEWDGEQKSWLLTAFEKAGDNTRTDIVNVDKRDDTARSLSSFTENLTQTEQKSTESKDLHKPETEIKPSKTQFTANAYTKESLTSKLKSVMDSKFGQGWTDRLFATGKFKVIDKAESAKIVSGKTKFSKNGFYVSWSPDTYDTEYDEDGEPTESEDIIFIDKVFVPESLRGKGIGTKMMLSAIKEIQKQYPHLPIRLAAYSLDQKNGLDQSDLTDWYERLGFDFHSNAGHAVVMEYSGDDLTNDDSISYPSDSDIDEEKIDKSDIQYSKNGEIQAFYNPKDDMTYLVADGISQHTDLEGLLKHELGVHALKMSEDDAGFQSILKQVEAMRGKNAAVDEAFKDAERAGTSAEDMTEEALGYLVEKHATQKITQRFLAWFRNAVRKLLGNHQLTEYDLHKMAREALRKAPDELMFDTTEPQGTKLSKASDIFKPIAEQAVKFKTALDKLMNNSLVSRPQPITVGEPSYVLQAVGVPNLPIIISKDTVLKATNLKKEGHDTPMSVIEKIPDILANPVMVLDSPSKDGGLVILSEYKDSSNRPVMISLHLDKQVNYVSVNKIASVYGRKDSSYFVNLARSGNVRYINEEKSRKWAQSERVQYPMGAFPKKGSQKDYITYDDLINSETPKFSKRQPASDFELPEETQMQKQQRLWQDSHNRWTTAQNAIKTNGGTIDDSNDVYKAMERMPHIAAERITDFKRETLNPLIERVARAKTNFDDIAKLLYAMHAPERNAQMQKINPRFKNGGGSGMTDQEAKIEIQKIKVKYGADFATIEAIAKDFQTITQDTARILEQSGAISTEEAAAYREAYKSYVPLKGFEKLDEKGNRSNGNGLGHSTSKKFGKRALGRESKAGQIIENIVRDHERAIIWQGKAEVGATVEQLINDNPDTIGTVDEIPVTKIMKGDKVTTMQTPFDPESEIRFLRDGKEVRIQLNDDLLLQSYNRLGESNLNGVFAASASLNRFLRQAWTQKNPAFFLINPIRDIQTAGVVLTGEGGVKLAAKAMKNWRSSWVTMLHHAMENENKLSADERDILKRYRESGGSVGTAYISSLERAGEKLHHELARHGGETFQSLIKAGKIKEAAKTAAFRALNNRLFDFIENLNTAFEGATRLAAFKAAIDSGYSDMQAASLSSNVTVNFTKRGELGQQLGAMYLFANANIQGTANIFKTLTESNYKGQAWGIVGGIVALSFMATMMGGDDGEDDLVSDYEKERNISIDIGDGKRITIPVAYGWSWFKDLGRAMAQMANGGDAEKISAKLASSFLGNFSPIGNPIPNGDFSADNALVAFAPTATKPFIMPTVNKGAFGTPLMPESPFKPNQPDSEKIYRKTRGTGYEDFAKGLNSLTGGDSATSGWIDISPETIKNTINYIAGGAGRFITDSAALAPTPFNDEAFKLENTPIAKSFYKSESIDDYRRRFYAQADDASRVAEQLAGYKKSGDKDRFRELYAEKGKLIALNKQVAVTKKTLQNLRDREDVARANGDSTASIEAQEKALLARFNSMYG